MEVPLHAALSPSSAAPAQGPGTPMVVSPDVRDCPEGGGPWDAPPAKREKTGSPGEAPMECHEAGVTQRHVEGVTEGPGEGHVACDVEGHVASGSCGGSRSSPMAEVEEAALSLSSRLAVDTAAVWGLGAVSSRVWEVRITSNASPPLPPLAAALLCPRTRIGQVKAT